MSLLIPNNKANSSTSSCEDMMMDSATSSAASSPNSRRSLPIACPPVSLESLLDDMQLESQTALAEERELAMIHRIVTSRQHARRSTASHQRLAPMIVQPIKPTPMMPIIDYTTVAGIAPAYCMTMQQQQQQPHNNLGSLLVAGGQYSAVYHNYQQGCYHNYTPACSEAADEEIFELEM